MKIVRANGFNEKMLLEALELDSINYPIEWRDSYENASERFHYYPEYLTNIYDDDGNCLGYLCIVPISDELFQRMFDEDIAVDGDNLTIDNLDLDSKHWFIYSICTYPNCQHQGVASALMRDLFQRVPKHVTDFTALCVAEGGLRVAAKFGFEAVKTVGTGETVVYRKL